MTDLIYQFIAMANNNAWSNQRLYRVCLTVSEEDFEEDTRANYFPSLQITLNHIFIIDRFYLAALDHQQPDYKMLNERVPFPKVGQLSTEQFEMDKRLIGLCRGLDVYALNSLVSFQRGADVHQEKVSDVLSHLFIHQIHHRGQVSAMLAATNVSAPQLDEFFLSSDREARAIDPPEVRVYTDGIR